MLNEVAYYVPTIPEVWSTDRYQHALSLIENLKNSIIICNNEIPDSICKIATQTYVLDTDSVLQRARLAADIAQREMRGGTYVTSYHYETALSGLIAKYRGRKWVPDVYETPAQYRLNNPRSYHQITSRGLETILNQADMAVHSFHPDTPYQYGSQRRFLTNGSPTSKISPLYPDEEIPSIVWVGSPRADRGGQILIDALSELNNNLTVDIYGKEDDRLMEYADRTGVQDQLVFHGWVPHNEALSAVRRASIGYAILPPRTDWLYAPAIKIGEYLAGGTIPLVSDFPGSRYVASDSGVYVQPTAGQVAARISDIIQEPKERRRKRMQLARERGEEISWQVIRERFKNKISRK